MIPFEIKTLKKVTQRNGEHRGFIQQKSLDTEAPLVRGETEDICEFLLMFLSILLQSSVCKIS